jgi:prophage DNA circulation protein
MSNHRNRRSADREIAVARTLTGDTEMYTEFRNLALRALQVLIDDPEISGSAHAFACELLERDVTAEVSDDDDRYYALVHRFYESLLAVMNVEH